MQEKPILGNFPGQALISPSKIISIKETGKREIQREFKASPGAKIIATDGPVELTFVRPADKGG